MIPAGTYQLAIPPSASENTAATGDLDIIDDLTIRGAGPHETILDGGQMEGVLIVAASLDLSGLTIQHATNAESSYVVGVLWLGGVGEQRLVISDTVIRENEIGLMAFFGGPGSVLVERAAFVSNSVYGCHSTEMRGRDPHELYYLWKSDRSGE